MQLKELWNYREMLGSLVKKDLKTRYKGSVLGFLWTFLNPLLQLLVYSLLFSVIMRANIDNYAMFLFVALVPWLFFSTSLVSGASCIMGAQGLIESFGSSYRFAGNHDHRILFCFGFDVNRICCKCIFSRLGIYFGDTDTGMDVLDTNSIFSRYGATAA